MHCAREKWNGRLCCDRRGGVYGLQWFQRECWWSPRLMEVVGERKKIILWDAPNKYFLSIPEFAVNPLSLYIYINSFTIQFNSIEVLTLIILQSLLRMLDGLNFKEFVAFLSAFSPLPLSTTKLSLSK